MLAQDIFDAPFAQLSHRFAVNHHILWRFDTKAYLIGVFIDVQKANGDIVANNHLTLLRRRFQ